MLLQASFRHLVRYFVSLCLISCVLCTLSFFASVQFQAVKKQRFDRADKGSSNKYNSLDTFVLMTISAYLERLFV